MNYNPKPINTSEVELSQDLLDLTERIAENVHDVYCAGRFAEGWKYGPKRDDIKKENPTLVPYSSLPNSEQEYDRNSALCTIKLIIKLGYNITKADKD